MEFWLLSLLILVALGLSTGVDSLLHWASWLWIPGWLGWAVVLGLGAWLLGDR